MNAITRLAACAAAAILAAALVAYAIGYYICIHRHYVSIAADLDFVFVDENVHVFFRPAIWIYERATGREVALNPLVTPVPSE
jgi:hypothetical protein